MHWTCLRRIRKPWRHQASWLKAAGSLLLGMGLFSCTPVFYALYGIRKTPDQIPLERLERFSAKQGIQSYYILDTAYSRRFRQVQPTQNLSNFGQPLQIKVFDPQANRLIAHVPNCKVGGFPNLNWKGVANLDSLLAGKTMRPDSLESYQQAYSLLRGPKLTELPDGSQQAEKEVWIYYTVFMKRQSKRLIRYVSKTLKGRESEQLRLRFIHADYLFSKCH